MKDIYIIGAGGLGKEIIWLLERINEQYMEWSIKGFIDNNKMLHGSFINGYPVCGGDSYFDGNFDEKWVVCAIASSKLRKKIISQYMQKENIHFATLIDPSVIYSSYITIGEGTVICAGSILTVNIDIGNYVIVNPDCKIGHDAVIEDFVTLYPSVNVSGNVTIGQLTEIGTGTQIIQEKNIGRESIIGAGSVVIRNIPKQCTAVGVPATPIKYFK